MTFSLVIHDPATGFFGSVIASSSPAVVARCVHLRDGVGAVHSQNITDPRLGDRVLDLLAAGRSADEALAAIVGSEPTADYRQLLVVDRDDRTAIHSGPNSLGIVAEFATQGAVAAGNMLATAHVPQALVEGWTEALGTVEARLIAALAAAVTEGGEAGPVHSAGVSVVSGVGWRTTDLRVDWSDDPVGDLDGLLKMWAPQRDDYIVRALDPSRSPGYGVPGDDR